ncbi:MAG TPA: sodium:solute symporter family protein [Tepidisphaeraceae bacterium]|nr:sodium:solute symporter family protein [Tepidisphaeraceae bacterium]
MRLALIDWIIIAAFLLLSLCIGVLASRRAGKNASEFFLSGRSMPWWLIGFSMVATTFSTDTPNLVTNFVRNDGVAGNWQWWAFLLTGMMTVFVFAKLWRRSGLMTDVAFYELRYSGKPAAFLRGFRAVYMAFIFGIIQQAAVTLAAIKIFGILIGMKPWQVILIGGGVTAVYSMVGGLRGVVWTDFFQFSVAMTGSIAAAVVAVNHPQIGSLGNLLAHENVRPLLSMVPDFADTNLLVGVFVMPLAVYWWAVWYPGSEPGGGAYVAQRILSAKNERHAMGATLFFQFAHYALRPWPWIIVALCSVIVFPDIASMQRQFPHIAADRVQNDLAYPAMLTFLPAGLMGLVTASLIAAYMSTLSTQLNLMSSYTVNDFYVRFVDPGASERRKVLVGRLMTLVLLCLSSLVALSLESAERAFTLIISIGAGTGLVFLLRWFWWRISAYSEIAGMSASLLTAMYFQFVHERLGLPSLQSWQQLLCTIAVTTIVWVVVTLLTPPTSEERLRQFYRAVRPGGPGWRRVRQRAQAEGEQMPSLHWDVPLGILCMLIGCMAVYGALFAIGNWIYGNTLHAVVLTLIALAAAAGILFLWGRLTTEKLEHRA